MIQVRYEQVRVSDFFHASTDASTIGLRPGEWPRVMGAQLRGWGNGADLHLERLLRDQEGDVTAGVYRQAGNGRAMTVVVYND